MRRSFFFFGRGWKLDRAVLLLKGSDCLTESKLDFLVDRSAIVSSDDLGLLHNILCNSQRIRIRLKSHRRTSF